MSEKNEQFKCNICNKYYSSKSSICNHNKKFHSESKSKVSIISKSYVCKSKSNINNNSIKCKYCDNTYKHKQSKWKHEQKCINKTNIIEENNKLKNKIIELESKTQIIQAVNNQQINNGIINEIINNNSNNKTIIINQVGHELFSCLPIKDILQIVNDGYNGPITCIKKLNFNKKNPENHSFCTTTLEGKHFTKINQKTQKPEKINKKEFIDEILESSLSYIEKIAFFIEFDDDFKEKIPSSFQEKINEILKNKNKFYENKNKKIFFNSINDLSYNFKELIMSTWKLLKKSENIQNNIDESDSDSEPIMDPNFNYMQSDDNSDNESLTDMIESY